ncbi:hypothetical protein ACLOJK_006830 [Asimina triloba]
MSTVLAFGFMPGGGFALNSHESFDPAIPHQFTHFPVSMARRTYRYTNYSPMAIALVAKGNWPSLIATITATRPPRKTATIAPRPSRKVASTPAAATTTPQPLHKVASTAAIAIPTSASQPFYEAVISTAVATATSASRSSRKTSFVVTLYSSSQVAHAQSRLRKAKRRLGKSSLVSRKTTCLDH